MKIDDFHRYVLNPGLSLLPEKMDSEAARRLLVATASQESGILYRKQIKGPARGYWQFEYPVIGGLLKHALTGHHLQEVCRRLDILPDMHEIHEAIRWSDPLACALARLNYYWYPKAIPTDKAGLWDYYIAVWRPGKPHISRWDASYITAENYVGDYLDV